jgi:hypothetical protein
VGVGVGEGEDEDEDEEGRVVKSVSVAGAGNRKIGCVVVVFIVVVLHMVSTWVIVDAFKNMGAGFLGFPKPDVMPATREMVNAVRMTRRPSMKNRAFLLSQCMWGKCVRGGRPLMSHRY